MKEYGRFFDSPKKIARAGAVVLAIGGTGIVGTEAVKSFANSSDNTLKITRQTVNASDILADFPQPVKIKPPSCNDCVDPELLNK